MTELLLACPLLAILGAATVPFVPRLNWVLAPLIGAVGIATASAGLAGHGQAGTWLQLDALGSVFLLVSAVVGTVSALLSSTYLGQRPDGFFAEGQRWYQLGLYLFWAALLVVPLSANLGLAWLLIEATTGASALLVAHSGRRRALEAGWSICC